MDAKLLEIRNAAGEIVAEAPLFIYDYEEARRVVERCVQPVTGLAINIAIALEQANAAQVDVCECEHTEGQHGEEGMVMLGGVLMHHWAVCSCEAPRSSVAKYTALLITEQEPVLANA